MDREIVRIASYDADKKAVLVVERGKLAGRHASLYIPTDPSVFAVGQRFVAALDFSPSLGAKGVAYVLVPIDSDEDAAAIFDAIRR